MIISYVVTLSTNTYRGIHMLIKPASFTSRNTSHSIDSQWSSMTRPSIRFSSFPSLTAGYAPLRARSSQHGLTFLKRMTLANSFAHLLLSSFGKCRYMDGVLHVNGLRIVGAGERGDTGCDLSSPKGSSVRNPTSTKHLVGICQISSGSVTSCSAGICTSMP